MSRAAGAIDRRAGRQPARQTGSACSTIRNSRIDITTAQLGITVASLGLGMYGEHVLADWLYGVLGGHGLPQWFASHGLASTIAVAISPALHVVGEMVPSVALQYAEQMALWVATDVLDQERAVSSCSR